MPGACRKGVEVSGAWPGTPPHTHTHTKPVSWATVHYKACVPQERQGTGFGFSFPVGGEDRDRPPHFETHIFPSCLLYSELLCKGGALWIRCLSSILRGLSKHTQEREGVSLCGAEMQIPTPAPTPNSGHRPAWSICLTGDATQGPWRQCSDLGRKSSKALRHGSKWFIQMSTSQVNACVEFLPEKVKVKVAQLCPTL